MLHKVKYLAMTALVLLCTACGDGKGDEPVPVPPGQDEPDPVVPEDPNALYNGITLPAQWPKWRARYGEA